MTLRYSLFILRYSLFDAFKYSKIATLKDCFFVSWGCHFCTRETDSTKVLFYFCSRFSVGHSFDEHTITFLRQN